MVKGEEKGESHQTYDLISGARTEIIWSKRPMISQGAISEAIIIRIMDLLSKGYTRRT